MEQMLRRSFNARVAEGLPTPTPLDRATTLSERLGPPRWLQRGGPPPGFSLQGGGAHDALAALDETRRRSGVIEASAGNHAQGVALAAQRLGLRCCIVMPRTTPSIKVEAVRRLGAQVELVGDDYSDAAARCAVLAGETGMTPLPPYHHLDVIAGPPPIRLAILSQAPRDLGAIFLPIGGGGLAARVAAGVE